MRPAGATMRAPMTVSVTSEALRISKPTVIVLLAPILARNPPGATTDCPGNAANPDGFNR